VGFWRKEIIDFALDDETRRHIEEQRAWIGRDPSDARPWRNLASLYRIQGKTDEALGLLLESVRLDPSYAPAHIELAEIYAVRADYESAWRHARAAEEQGDCRAADLLRRHRIA